MLATTASTINVLFEKHVVSPIHVLKDIAAFRTQANRAPPVTVHMSVCKQRAVQRNRVRRTLSVPMASVFDFAAESQGFRAPMEKFVLTLKTAAIPPVGEETAVVCASRRGVRPCVATPSGRIAAPATITAKRTARKKNV